MTHLYTNQNKRYVLRDRVNLPRIMLTPDGQCNTLLGSLKYLSLFLHPGVVLQQYPAALLAKLQRPMAQQSITSLFPTPTHSDRQRGEGSHVTIFNPKLYAEAVQSAGCFYHADETGKGHEKQHCHTCFPSLLQIKNYSLVAQK